MGEVKKVSRRDYLKYTGAAIGGLIVGGALGYLAKPAEVVEKTATVTAPGVEKTITTTVEKTVTKTVTGTPTLTLTGPIELEWWHNDNRPAWIEACEFLMNEYHKRHPNVTIRKEVVGWVNEPKILAAIQTKTVPDIAMSYSGGAVTFAATGGLIPVTDIIEEHGKNDFPPSDIKTVSWKGEYWAVPDIDTIHVLWCRKDFLDEKGLKPPKTWDDLLSVAKALTEDTDKDGKIDRYGVAWALGGVDGPEVIWAFMRTNDAEIFDENLNIIFNSKETKETYEFLKELHPYVWPGYVTMSETDVRLQIIDGKAAMGITSTSFIYDCIRAGKEEILEKFITVPIPIKKHYGTFHCSTHYFVFKDAKHKEVAKDFLKFMLEPDILAQYAAICPTGFIPATYSAQKNPLWRESPLVKKYWHLIEPGVLQAPYMSIPGAANRMNPYVGAIQARLILPKAFAKIITENVSVDEALKWAESEIRKVVKEIGPAE